MSVNAHSLDSEMIAVPLAAPDSSRLDSLNNAGATLYIKGNLRGALHFWSQALSLAPRSNETYLARAIARMHLEDYSGAFVDLQTVLMLDADNANAYNNRGCCHHFQGRQAEALRDFTRAVEIDPRLASARINRAQVYLTLKLYEQALWDCQAAVALEPEPVLLALAHDIIRRSLRHLEELYDEAGKPLCS